jgi:MoxR-like ATPase
MMMSHPPWNESYASGQLDSVDLRGLPRTAADQAEWVPPKFLPTSGHGILFLDELTSAPQMTQAGCYQLVLDRKLGEYQLPEGWVVIAAGNPASERGVHFSMPRPLRNRFVHLDLEPDFEDWTKWAVKAGKHCRRHLWRAPGESRLSS